MVGGLTVGVLVLAALGLLWASMRELPGDGTEPVPVPAPRPERRAPAVVPPAAADGPMGRRPLPAPVGHEPARRPDNATKANLSTEQWRDYNTAVHELVTRARKQCLRPYVRDAGLGRIEVVIDAVLWDGEVVDFGIRGLQDVPDHVLDCVAEEAWGTQFPAHDIPGEVRLQRSVPVEGQLAD